MTIGDGGGDRDERFKTLYQKYYWRMVRFYLRAFHLSQEDAQDLAQDAFIRFYEAMDEYRGDAEWAFLETIARNVAYNKIRSGKAKKRYVKTVDIDDPEVMIEPAVPAPDHAELQQAELRRKQLYDAIERLSPGQRECLLLSLEGFQYEEIATALRISVDAVRSRLRDARKTLRSRLGEDDTLPEDEE